MLGPFATASRRMSMSTTTTTTTTTTMRDRGDHYGPLEWAQSHCRLGYNLVRHFICSISLHHPLLSIRSLRCFHQTLCESNTSLASLRGRWIEL